MMQYSEISIQGRRSPKFGAACVTKLKCNYRVALFCSVWIRFWHTYFWWFCQ